VIEPGRYVPKFVTRELTPAVKADAASTFAGKEGASDQIATANVNRSQLWRSLAIVAGIGPVAAGEIEVREAVVVVIQGGDAATLGLGKVIADIRGLIVLVLSEKCERGSTSFNAG
jgi:hypothetical protein